VSASAGVVCDKGLTLRDLIGTLKMFFDRLGLKKLRFKPAYNPYTEPSMEIFRWLHDPTLCYNLCAHSLELPLTLKGSCNHCLLAHILFILFYDCMLHCGAG